MALIIGGPHDGELVDAPDDMRALLLVEKGVRVAYRRRTFGWTRGPEQSAVCFVAPDVSDADAATRFWWMAHTPPAAVAKPAPDNDALFQLLLEAMEIQRKNYGNGMALHLAMTEWGAKARALMGEVGPC